MTRITDAHNDSCHITIKLGYYNNKLLLFISRNNEETLQLFLCDR